MEGEITRFLCRHRSLILLSLLAILISGCASSPQERVWTQAPGWSRGQLIGTSASTNLVPIARDPDGNVYLAYLSDQEPEGLRFVSIDPQGALRWTQPLPESENDYGRSAQLIFRQDRLIAFWLDSGQVIMQQVSSDGEFLKGPIPVAQTREVAYFDLAQNGVEDLVLWFSGSSDDPGLFALDLLQPEAEAVLIDPSGIQPDVAVDEYGVTHAVWMTAAPLVQDAQIRYQSFPPGYLQLADHPIVIETEFSTTDEIEPASIAIDRYFGYIFWTTIIHTGLRAGAIDSFYLSFSLIDPTQQHFGKLLYPMSFELDLERMDPGSGVTAGERLSWSESNPGSDQVRELVPAASQKTETGVVFRARVPTRSGQSQTQIGALFFSDGLEESYQLLTFTNTASTHPNVLVDDAGYLFASWLELTDVRQYSVYLATTAPSFRSNFDQLTYGDYRRMAGDTLFGMISGVILIPIAFLWMVVPLASLGITSILRRHESSLFRPGHLISLGIAVGIYWFLKLSIFSNLRTSIPLILWIPVIPVSWYPWLRYGVPVLGTGVAMVVALWSMRRTERTSPVIAFLIYGLVDGLFTVALYGGSLFGM